MNLPALDREERVERICQRNRAAAKENIEARMLAAWDENRRMYPALEVASEVLCEMNHHQRERLADALWSRDACALGDVMLEGLEKYMTEYFRDHADDVDEECLVIAAGPDADWED